jgi:hypothetical protein
MSQAKNASNATPTDLSKDEISLLRTLKELGLPASRLTKLLSPKEETHAPARADEFDLVDVYHRAYSKALAIALERQALRDAGLLTQEEERPHNDNMNSFNAIVEALKSRPQGEKLTVSDLTMLILASNLGGGANKADNAISLKDLLPLLSKRELTVADVMAILDKTRPPPAPAAMPTTNSSFADLFDDSIKQVLKEKIIKALSEESKRGPSADWGGIASRIIDTIRDVTGKIPPPQAPPPETVSGPPIPAAESPPPPAEAAPVAASSVETTAASPSVTSEASAASSPTTSTSTAQDLGGIEG